MGKLDDEQSTELSRMFCRSIDEQLDLPFDPHYMYSLEVKAWILYCNEYDLGPGDTWSTLSVVVKGPQLRSTQYEPPIAGGVVDLCQK